MALHKREQILAALTLQLTGLNSTMNNVTRGRVYSIDEDTLPHLSIYQGEDTIETPDGEDESTNLRLYSTLPVIIEITNDASSGVLETQINQICKEITIALMEDTTLGGLCLNVIEKGTGQPELSDLRKKRTAVTEMKFDIFYRRSRTDPSQ